MQEQWFFTYAIETPNSDIDLILYLIKMRRKYIDSYPFEITDKSGKTITKPLRGYIDNKLEPLYIKLQKKIALTDSEQKTFDRFVTIKNYVLSVGAKPKTRKGINTLGKNVLVYPENAKHLTPEWKDKLGIKGGKRTTLRKRKI